MQKYFYILPILIILVSGCTSSRGSGPGVVIETFETDFNDVFYSEDVTFSVKIRNQGSVDAKNLKVVLLGLDEWGQQGNIEMDCSGKVGLRAGQQAFGTSGEVVVCTHKAKAPEVPQGLPVTYQPSVRVSYSYQSSVVKTINVGSQQELRRIQNLGGALPSETTSVTSGPIAIDVVNQGPIRLFGADIKFPIEITLSNVGGGVACKEACNSENWNTININVKMAGQELNDCGGELSLFRGQTNSITCTSTLTTDSAESGIVQKTIEVSSNYNYFIDGITSIKVNPLPS